MLDFGFSEILLTSVIALVVLGPERLPKVARQVGNWMGRARAMARQLSEQLDREISADELLKQSFKTNAADAIGDAHATSAESMHPPLPPDTRSAVDSANTPHDAAVDAHRPPSLHE